MVAGGAAQQGGDLPSHVRRGDTLADHTSLADGIQYICLSCCVMVKSKELQHVSVNSTLTIIVDRSINISCLMMVNRGGIHAKALHLLCHFCPPRG